MLLITSCETTKVTSEVLPDLDFPEPILDINNDLITETWSEDKKTVTYTWYLEDKTLTLPAWFWFDLVGYEYKISQTKKQYQVIQETYVQE